MKNNYLIFAIFCFWTFGQNLYADSFQFNVKDISIENEGNVIYANDGKVVSKNKNLEIIAKKYKYINSLDQLDSSDGNIFIKNENIKIKFNQIKLNNKNNIITASNGIKIDDLKKSLNIQGENIIFDRNKNIITASNGIKIDDLKKSLNIQGENIIFDRNNNFLYSKTTTFITDKYGNQITTKNFEHKINEKDIKIFNALMRDSENNTFEIESAYIDMQSNMLIGKNIIVNLNNKYFNADNEPRLKGDQIVHDDNFTVITKGSFTPCKKTDDCPPWELSADKITHDTKKKSINYENVWLKIYDVPVVYFPKFFHPDPTVKRQSGFLMPTFENTLNNTNYFSIPYFKVLSESKDLTFTPKFNSKDQFLVQNEYREARKDSNIISDTSLFFNKNESIEGHLFYNFNKNLNLNKFDFSNLKFNFEQVSNDTYLKANKLQSPLINDYDLLETSIKLNMTSEILDIKSKFLVYEKLNISDSDKYEYILPQIDLTRNLNNNTKLNGDFKFQTNNYIHNYETNIYDRINTNNLIFTSVPKITNNGLYNNYEFIIKNANSNSENSKSNKEGEDIYLSGLFQFNSSLPLIKKTNSYNSLLKPKISAKINPGHTKDLSNNEYKIDVNNIFNLNRISSEETLESGMSLAYGTDYTLTKAGSGKDILSIKFANNLRLNKNDDLERNNQLGSKTSNFFGELKYNPIDFISTKYNFSTRNNLSDINYQNFIAEIRFNKFINTFDYLRQDEDKNSYFLNETTFKLNSKNNLSFSTRENLKTDLTEYYNLIYQYKNDCLAASIEYQKEYYDDQDVQPKENIFFKITLIPFGLSTSPNLK